MIENMTEDNIRTLINYDTTMHLRVDSDKELHVIVSKQ